MSFKIGTILIFSLGLLVGVISCDTKNNVEPVYKQYFIKYYGEDGNQEGTDFVVNDDGTIIILGTSTFGLSKRIYLVKVDAEGNEIWKKTLGSPSNEFAQDIEPIVSGPDVGNFAVLSNVEKNEIDFQIRLTVISTNGDSLKSTLFNRLVSQRGKSVTPISDGGYFIAGNTTDTDKTQGGANAGLPDPSLDAEDLLIIRLKNDFSFIESDVTRIGGSYEGSAIKIFQAGNVFYYGSHSDEITKGDLPDNGTYESNFVFRTFISNPNSISSVYAGKLDQHETMQAIAKSPSGIFLAVGTQTDLNATTKQVFAATVTNNFSKIEKSEVISGGGPQREAVAVAAAGASRFFILANEFNAASKRDIYLQKVNIFLERDFELRFGSPNNDDTASAVTELPNGDILILGTMNITNQKKIALIKLNSAGKFE